MPHTVAVFPWEPRFCRRSGGVCVRPGGCLPRGWAVLKPDRLSLNARGTAQHHRRTPHGGIWRPVENHRFSTTNSTDSWIYQHINSYKVRKSPALVHYLKGFEYVLMYYLSSKSIVCKETQTTRMHPCVFLHRRLFTVHFNLILCRRSHVGG